MNRPRLMLRPDNMPPLWQPMLFLATAPIALMMAVALQISEPVLHGQTWPTTGRAILHLITLGVFGTSALGASIQLFPVVLGIPLRFQTGELITLWLMWTGSVSLLVLHLYWPQLPIGTTGASMALAVFTYWMWKARSGLKHLVLSAQSGIRTLPLLLSLMAATGLALLTGEAPISPHQHALLGLGILVPSVVFSVGLHVIPMFYTPGEIDTSIAKYWYWTAAISLAAIFIRPNHAAVGISILHLWMAGSLFALLNRRRRRADTTVRFWQLALAGQIFTVFAYWLAVWHHLRWRTVIACSLVGFIVPVIMGMSQRIGAFLTTLHAQRLGITRPLSMRDVIAEKSQQRVFRYYVAGVLLLASSVWMPEIERAASLVLGLAILLWLRNLIGIPKVIFQRATKP